MNEEEITCPSCGDDKYTTSWRIMMIEADITCPNCGDDKYTTVTMQEAYGMDTHIGHCDECHHRWNEDAR